MSKAEASELLANKLWELRDTPYSELRRRLGPEHKRTFLRGFVAVSRYDSDFERIEEVVGPSGTEYQFEFDLAFDGDSEGPIRVFVTIREEARVGTEIDEYFIRAPDESFVNE